MNVAQPLGDLMPTDVNEYIGSTDISLDSWIINRAHLKQAIIARQVHHDVLLSWVHLTPDISHEHIAMRIHFPTDVELAAASTQIQHEIIMRGGFVLLHPLRDTVTSAVNADWDTIYNPLPNRRVNVLNVHGQAGMHYNIMSEFLTRHPDARSFRITQLNHDNGDVFFLINPEV